MSVNGWQLVLQQSIAQLCGSEHGPAVRQARGERPSPPHAAAGECGTMRGAQGLWF